MKRWQSLKRLWEPFMDNGANVYAAGACFYLLMSMFPAILVILLIMPYFPFTLENLLVWLETVVPVPVFPFVEYAVGVVQNNANVALLSVSSVTAIWAASRGVLSIMDGLYAVLDIREKKTFILRRLLSIVYFLILVVCMVGMLLLYVFGGNLYKLMMNISPIRMPWLELVFDWRYIYTLGLFAVLTVMIYWLFPSRRISMKWCVVGGLMTAADWTLFSYGFSLYVRWMPDSGKLYGTLGAMILGGIWLYVCLLFLLFNVQFCGLMQAGKYHPIRILRESFAPAKR